MHFGLGLGDSEQQASRISGASAGNRRGAVVLAVGLFGDPKQPVGARWSCSGVSNQSDARASIQ
ncbi:hypothetical protein CKO40_04570 [Halochromatium glycolicum]|uniref:Uncharacterized protein n=1 Tax=Halochromatium glycolicum TaxID=85075 RepID=A0AAJ0X9A1_9GAMM|nr:hypothetical protein [Halochromatium glycolicum]